MGLFAIAAVVTAATILLNLAGGDETASLLGPSPSQTSEPSATPVREPPPPPPNDVPDPSFAASLPPLESMGAVPSPQPGTDPWLLAADHFRGRIGEQFSYHCPPGGEPWIIWGTSVYTDDSSVCTAAVHAGFITLAEGGDVTLVMLAGQGYYEGSTNHGIESISYPAWYGSYAFVVP